MKILVVEPLKVPYEKEIDGSLASMQAVVGGLIQLLYPFEDPELALICNDEGMQMDRSTFKRHWNALKEMLREQLKAYRYKNLEFSKKSGPLCWFTSSG